VTLQEERDRYHVALLEIAALNGNHYSKRIAIAALTSPRDPRATATATVAGGDDEPEAPPPSVHDDVHP
jgi:hypothetical protein